MTEPLDDNCQFKLPLDDDEIGTEIPAAVDELRLEKLNNRVTIISILIPVLIVIVLVIAYLDIKKRVVQTKDTGTIGVQKLSSDLESRFSSLSVRQARLEDDMTRLSEGLDQSVARIEVKLKQTGDTIAGLSDTISGLNDTIGGLKQSLAGKTELKRATSELDKKISNIAAGLEELQAQVAALPQAIDTLALKVREEQRADRSRDEQLASIKSQISALDKAKLEKPALDLALRLETLKLENFLKAQLESVDIKLNALEKRLAELAKTRTSFVPRTQAQPLPQAPSGDANNTVVLEQPLPE